MLDIKDEDTDADQAGSLRQTQKCIDDTLDTDSKSFFAAAHNSGRSRAQWHNPANGASGQR